MRIDIVRAWKDEAYRASLSTEEQAMLPENPAGVLELSEAELEAIHGANSNTYSIAPVCINSGIAAGCASYNQQGSCFNSYEGDN